MSTFTVHVPPGVADEAARAERTVVLRDGFDWPSFLFGPLPLLYRGLWRASLLWTLAFVALLAIAARFELSAGPRLALYLVLALLTGLEAAEARRAALGRAGFIPAALLTGLTRESAEQTFFGGIAMTTPLASSPLPPGSLVPRRGAGVIGLFPRSDARPSGNAS